MAATACALRRLNASKKAAINNDLSKEMTVMKTHAQRKQDVEAGFEWESAWDAAHIGLAVEYGVVKANG